MQMRTVLTLEEYSEVYRALEALFAESGGINTGLGGLAVEAERMGLVLHFDHEGRYTGCQASWLQSSGVEVSLKDVARVCEAVSAVARLYTRFSVGADK